MSETVRAGRTDAAAGQGSVRTLRIASLAVAAGIAVQLIGVSESSARVICTVAECGTNHNERAARDGMRLTSLLGVVASLGAAGGRVSRGLSLPWLCSRPVSWSRSMLRGAL